MKSLVETIAKGIVEKPEEVSVTEVKGEKLTVLELRVNEEDLGKVIGKQGRIAKAIRTLISSAGKKTKKRSALEILE